MQTLKSLWKDKPLPLIMLAALLLRLISVIFSRGYGMHDDHFLVIETAQSWLDHADYNNWFKNRIENGEPTILNFFYTGFHYLLFLFLQKLGLTDPQLKMLLVRLIHAVWSLLIVYSGYKITLKLAGEHSAKIAGLILATLWIFPFFSVRNLVEYACIPFLMLGFCHLLIAGEKEKPWTNLLLSGLMFGFAFAMRFQTAIFPGVAGVVLLVTGKWKQCLMLAAGFLVVPLLLLGVADWIIWGRPFAELQTYITHNIEHRFDYNVAPWYLYLTVLIGFLLIPVSLFLLAGFLMTWKKAPLLFWPALVFIVFHSLFPNKQERFILPVVPFIIILGTYGWNEFVSRSRFWQRFPKLHRAGWAFFWILNTLLVFPFSSSYSKKARVESMTYLSAYPDIKTLILDDSDRGHATMMPLYYLSQWPEILTITSEIPTERLADRLKPAGGPPPAFVLFFGDKNLDQRVEKIKALLPGLVPETVIPPGFTDWLVHRINPINANQTIYIYRNTEAIPKSLVQADGPQ